MAIRLFQPFVSWRAKWNAVKTLSSGYLSEGDRVKQFENEFKKLFNLTNVVAVNSATSALTLAYDLADIQSGDRVIVPVLTCAATSIELARRGAKIVFADIDEDLNISIDDVKRKITPDTKAVVFVHFGGNNRGLEDIQAICRMRNITLIEDAAQAVGSAYWGNSDFACVSLQAIKNLTSGDGGFLICKNDFDYERAKKLRWFGYDRDLKKLKGDTDIVEAGYKFHMNDVTASIGLGNLKSIDKLFKHKDKLAKIYRSYGLFDHAWLAGGFTDNYDALKYIYESHGIEIGQHHYDNRKYTVFKPFYSDCPMMDKQSKRYFFVPYHFEVSLKQAHLIGTIYAKCSTNNQK